MKRCMKKLFILLILLVICATVYAQNNAESISTIQNLIEDSLFSNEDTIASEARQLSLPERMLLYDKYEKSVVGPVLLNMILGYGIGSYRQGDTGFGVMSTLTDLTCNAMILTSLIQMFSYGADYLQSDDLILNPESERKYNKAISRMVLFSCIKGGWDFFAIIRPFIFKNTYNTTLENVLGIRENETQISLNPVIDTNGNAGLSIGFSF